jgi:CubicO group peptidase (beta-lactamase class C family)
MTRPTRSPIELLPAMQAALDDLAPAHDVPGAVLAVSLDGQTVEVATGVASAGTGVEVTPETLFQIGSNTKIYTTTLVLQLVDEGKVDLDAPLRTYLPDLALGDPVATETVTARHLVTHSSGIEGDYFDDHGRGDDCVKQYVASLAGIGQIHPPGAMFSYCNSGFTLAGRLIEQVTGQWYHEALQERILAPLGLADTSVLVEDMIGHRYAVGHLHEGGRLAPTSVVMMPRSSTPAGSRTSATARDVLDFVGMHLNGGRASDGRQVLSAGQVAAMQAPSLPIPGRSGGHVGLGWMLDDWGGSRLMGHTGGTIGQLSFVEAVPELGLAVCLLTNSDSGDLLWGQVGAWIIDQLAGIAMPSPALGEDRRPGLDLDRYVGTYERLNFTYEVCATDDHLELAVRASGLGAGLDHPPARGPLRPFGDHQFRWTNQGHPMILTFHDFDTSGQPRYLHAGSRVSRRLSSTG